jgi:hypothetical protein
MSDSGFYRKVRAAIARHEDNDGEMVCPVCKEVMWVVHRGRRMTFGGEEPACVQYHCDSCGLGGEDLV